MDADKCNYNVRIGRNQVVNDNIYVRFGKYVEMYGICIVYVYCYGYIGTSEKVVFMYDGFKRK